MQPSRSLYLGLLACIFLAASAASAWADLPGPGPRPRPGPPLPPPQPTDVEPAPQPPPPPIDPVTGKPLFDTREEKKPRRTGPLRSCGSGMGLGLAGIGLAWGMLWLGNRFAGRVRGQKDERAS